MKTVPKKQWSPEAWVGVWALLFLTSVAFGTYIPLASFLSGGTEQSGCLPSGPPVWLTLGNVLIRFTSFDPLNHIEMQKLYYCLSLSSYGDDVHNCACRGLHCVKSTIVACRSFYVGSIIVFLLLRCRILFWSFFFFFFFGTYSCS